jgi:hypothetical protein
MPRRGRGRRAKKIDSTIQDIDTPRHSGFPDVPPGYNPGRFERQEPNPSEPRPVLPKLSFFAPVTPARGGYIPPHLRNQVKNQRDKELAAEIADSFAPSPSPSERCVSPAPAPAPSRGGYIPPILRNQGNKELAAESPDPYAPDAPRSPSPRCESPAPARKNTEHAVDIDSFEPSSPLCLGQRPLPSGYVRPCGRYEPLSRPELSRPRCPKNRERAEENDDPFGLRAPQSPDQARSPGGWPGFESPSPQSWTSWRSRAAASIPIQSPAEQLILASKAPTAAEQLKS